jgi:hypothetical protein
MMKFSEIDRKYPIQVEGKFGSVVMIVADGASSRRIVEDAFPDVEWSTDERLRNGHPSGDWMFTHIKVTRLQPHLEKSVPLAFAEPDSLSYAVASFLRDRWALDIAFWIGDGHDIRLNVLAGGPISYEEGVDRMLYADYVPAGVPLTRDQVVGR